MARPDGMKAKKIARGGVRTVGGILSLALKIIGSLLLIVITTGIIFSCIFAVYVKNNLATDMGISLDEFAVDLSSVLYYQNKDTGQWEELVTLQSEYFRKWIEYEDIPINLEHALVAIEDQRFYTHSGVDWYRTVAAFGNMFLNMRDTAFGGSTITQQLIKNLTTEDDVTVQRKLLEIFRALELEKEYEKRDIIEWYLNYVYFGHGCYGIGAAANFYFGKEVGELTLAECASIIGITNNPSRYSPYSYPKNNKDRQETVLYKMLEQGYISQTEYDAAMRQQLVFQRGEDEVYEEIIYTWFEEAVINEVLEDLQEIKGVPSKFARDLLFYGGYRIYTTFDPDIQAAVDAVYLDVDGLPKVTGSSAQLQSSIVIVDPYTGDIPALSGGVGEKTANLLRNRATMARRSPGSSIKPLTAYAPAMDLNLLTPATKFNDSASVVLTGKPDWLPRNDDRNHRGIVTVKYALQRSINTIAAQIVDKLTPDVAYKFATEKLGLGLVPADNDYAPLALGGLTYGVTVREMAEAYTIFPNEGLRNKTRTYTMLYDADDNLVYEKKRESVTAISDTTAYHMNVLLQNAVTSGTGYEARLTNMPTAGKTGTTSDKKDRWFTGYTPYYVAAVWTGYDTPAEMTVRGNPAAQIWKRVMDPIHENLESRDFFQPASTYQPPVPGIEDEVQYTVRYMLENGYVFYEDTGTGIAGDSKTLTAVAQDGYIVVGDATKTISLSLNPGENLFVFVFRQVVPEPPEETDTPPPEETEAPPESPPPEESLDPPEPPENGNGPV